MEDEALVDVALPLERSSASCSKYICPHCSCELSKKAYNAHKRLYYDNSTHQWIKKRHVTDLEVELFDETDFEVEPSIHMSDDNHDAPPIVDFEDCCEEPDEEGLELLAGEPLCNVESRQDESLEGILKSYMRYLA